MKGEGEVDDVGISTVGVRGEDASDSSSSSFLHLKVLQLLGQQIYFWGQKQKPFGKRAIRQTELLHKKACLRASAWLSQ